MKKHLYLFLGWLFLIIGIIGIFLPILPTTPFALLAAYFFQRSSKRLHNWLLQQPILGPAIQDWDDNKIIRPKAKILAVSFIIVGISYPIFFKIIPIELKVIIGVVATVVISYILSRPSYAKATQSANTRSTKDTPEIIN